MAFDGEGFSRRMGGVRWTEGLCNRRCLWPGRVHHLVAATIGGISVEDVAFVVLVEHADAGQVLALRFLHPVVVENFTRRHLLRVKDTPKPQLKSLPKEDAHLKRQPIRRLNASSLGKCPRDTAT